MIVLFTDFGVTGPYVGQMEAVLHREAAGIPAVNLFADAPTHDPRAAAYLLPAYAAEFPPGTVFLCVVDPGVGGDRAAVILKADGRFYVGPGNGLFELVARRSVEPPRWWDITWRPERLSASFHGRDLFAPTAARLARGEDPDGETWAARRSDSAALDRPDWPDDLDEVVYLDAFGNAMTGVRADTVDASAEVLVSGRRLRRARTFSDVSPGEAFWYENANGLLEIAVNQGRADTALGLVPGTPIAFKLL